jgi:hypothetical protein
MDKVLVGILESQKDMAVDISAIKVSLEYHIKRTNLLEESVKIAKEQLASDMKPIRAHVTLVNNTLKLFGGFSILIGTIAAIMEIYSYIVGI